MKICHAIQFWKALAMEQKTIDIKKQHQTRRACIGIVIWGIMLTNIVGCAGLGTKKPPPTDVPVIEQLSVAQDGFTIKEPIQLDAKLQADFERAIGLLKDKKYDQAVPLLNKITMQAPKATAPHINLAIAYKEMKKNKQAEAQLKKALEIFPAHPVASNEYGLILRKSGRFAEAKTVYEKALAKFPNYYPIHRNLGILCDLYLNELPCALEHYEIYSKALPQDKQVKLWIADLKGRM